MKIYFPQNITQKDLNFCMELFPIIPFISSTVYKQITTTLNWWNEGLFSSLYQNTPCNELVKIEDCDFCVLPFKFFPNDQRVLDLCKEAALLNKTVIAFFCDDYIEPFNLPSNLILFRTSTSKSLISNQERVFPVLVSDHLPKNLLVELSDKQDNKILGFRGHNQAIRENIIKKIQSVTKNIDFEIQKDFYFGDTSKMSTSKTRQDYYSNLSRNQFTLCIRGGGNFSYRFYEALSFGRIPVLIDTDIVLPFQNIINWNNHIVKIPIEEIDSIEDIIKSSNISPIDNRMLWCKYFSTEGYTQHFALDI